MLHLSLVAYRIRFPPRIFAFRKIPLVSKAFAAFGAAARKNLAAVAIEHALAKAVFFFAVQLFGLICAFHIKTNPFATCGGAPSLRCFLLKTR